MRKDLLDIPLFLRRPEGMTENEKAQRRALSEPQGGSTELLASMDKGPWIVFESRKTGSLIGVASDDFNHDVVLKVTGDFNDNNQKRRYCQALADKLNSAG